MQASVDATIHPALNHNIYRLIGMKMVLFWTAFFTSYNAQISAGINLLSIITRSLYNDWRPWENTFTGKRATTIRKRK